MAKSKSKAGATTKKTGSYGASDIDLVEHIAHVRLRPGMYLLR